MAVLIISLILGYIFVGWGRVFKALAASPLDAPLWTSNPTTARIALNLFLWPVVQCFETYYAVRGLWLRAITFGATQSLIQLGAAFGWIYVCLFLADYWADSKFSQLLLSAFLLVPGIFILAPLFAIISIPVSIFIMGLLELLFSCKKGPKV